MEEKFFFKTEKDLLGGTYTIIKMEEKVEIKTERDTLSDEDRSDSCDYSTGIKHEPLAIKQEPAEIAELEDAAIHVGNIFIAKPEVDFDVKTEEIGNGLSTVERKCDICGECFSNRFDLVAHRHTHTEDTYYTCCICKYNTFHLNYLQRHMFNVHFNLSSKIPISVKRKTPKRSYNDEKPYKCDLCGGRFRYPSVLVAHKRVHTGEKPYECDVCHRRFNQTTHLKNHKCIHAEEPYECDVCHKRFQTANFLTKHKRNHSDEKPYKCELCHKSFIQKYMLTIHKRAHSGEKPYECDVCYKRFKSNSELKRHLRIHTKTPFKCNMFPN